MASPPDYLLPDFDPSKAKIADLRNWLLQHDVAYPSNAKKGDLVKAFELNIRPHAKKHLAALAKIRASDHGILDGESQNGSLAELDTSSDIEVKPEDLPPAKRKRGKRDPARTADDITATTGKADHAFMKLESSPDASPQKRRKSNVSLISAQKRLKDDRKSVEATAPFDHGSEGETGFSDFNPFQSGGESSPEKVRRRKSSIGPRKIHGEDLSGSTSPRKSLPNLPSGGLWEAADRNIFSPSKAVESIRNTAEEKIFPKKSTLSRQIGGEDELRPETPHSRTAFQDESPTQSVRKRSTKAGKPEVQLERKASPSKSSSDNPTPTRYKKAGPGRQALQPLRQVSQVHKQAVPMYTQTIKRICVLLSSVAFILYVIWWREEKTAAGFCDTSSTTNDIVSGRRLSLVLPSVSSRGPIPSNVLQFLDKSQIRPSCTPCPDHARCMEGLLLCDPDYIIHPHPLNLNGLLPIAPRCVPDTEKLIAIATQASKAARILSRRRGQVVCQGLEKIRKKSHSSEAAIYGMTVDILMAALNRDNELSGLPLSADSLADINRLALRDLESHGELLTSQQGDEYWYASTKADMDLRCRFRRAVLRYAERQKRTIVGAVLLLAGLAGLRSWIRKRSQENDLVRQLVLAALRQLQDQERLHYTDPVLAPTSHIVPAHLRDLILQDKHSPAYRRRLWQRVEKVVEGNANVRAKQVEFNGEEMLAWDWTGQGLHSIEGPR